MACSNTRPGEPLSYEEAVEMMGRMKASTDRMEEVVLSQHSLTAGIERIVTALERVFALERFAELERSAQSGGAS